MVPDEAPHNVRQLKLELLRITSACLLKDKSYSGRGEKAPRIVDIVRTLARTCPEFVLKLALYLRDDLHIRSTANFVAAVAATTPLCMPYLRAYLPMIIVLPSDWVQVAQYASDLIRHSALIHARHARLAQGDRAGGGGVEFEDTAAATPPADLTLPPLIKGLPTALRNALAETFQKFNLYQLAKYDDDKRLVSRNKRQALSKERKAALAEGRAGCRVGRVSRGGRGGGGVPIEEQEKEDAMKEEGSGGESSGDDDDSEGDDEDEEDAAALPAGIREPKVYTIKRLVRALHLTAPVYSIMSLTGQPYPASADEFESCGLSDALSTKRAKEADDEADAASDVSSEEDAAAEWNEALAGTRMKLPPPATWETALTASGNRSETWETLIDATPPLPFMAMLRNLRNIILCGVSEDHHKKVLARLRSPHQVMRSKQFPHRFVTAYGALKLKSGTDYINPVLDLAGNYVSQRTSKARSQFKKNQDFTKTFYPTRPILPELLDQYSDALDESVRLATVHNLSPIYGRTVVLCNVKESPIGSGQQGVGSVRTVRGLSLLLALMFHHGCENCEIKLYDSETGQTKHVSSLKGASILKNLDTLNNIVSEMQTAAVRASGAQGAAFPFDVLARALREESHIDNVIVIDDRHVGNSPLFPAHDLADQNPQGTGGVSAALHKLRQHVNPDLLYVSVDIAGNAAADERKRARRAGIAVRTDVCKEDPAGHPNDVFITGFSDAILRFVAERGPAQLDYVDSIDEAKGVPKELVNYDTVANKLKEATGMGIVAHEAAEDEEDEEEEEEEEEEEDEEDDSYDGTETETETESRSRASWTGTNRSSQVCSGGGGGARSRVSRGVRFAAPEHGGWADVRVFVSSTFLDMQTEREILATRVFPKLRRWCAAEGINARITDVDLRWGVTSADAEKGLAPGVCLNQVEACKPFFVGLVGGRYGRTVASYEQIAPVPDLLTGHHADTREARKQCGASAKCFAWLAETAPGKSVTELEMLHGALGVNPSRHSFFYLRDQEALLDTVPRDLKHLFEPESADKKQQVAELRELIARKGESGEGLLRARRYSARCSVSSSELIGLAAFEEQVTLDLWRAIVEECPPAARRGGAAAATGPSGMPRVDSAATGDAEAAHAEAQEQFLAEQSSHLTFLSQKAQRFSGRGAYVETLVSWAQGTRKPADEGAAACDPNVCVVVGDEGAGKSAVAAVVCRRLERQGKAVAGEETVVVPHFVGCTPASRNPQALLMRLIREFRTLLGEEGSGEAAAAADEEGLTLVQVYEGLRQRVAKAMKVVVVVDGLDKLEPQELAQPVVSALSPPAERASQVRFVFTVTTRGWGHTTLLKRASPVPVHPIPDLTLKERKDLVRKLAHLYGKRVEEDLSRQGGAIIAPLAKKAAARSPEYLSLAMEFLRVNATFATIGSIVRELPTAMPKFFEYLLSYLDNGRHGLVKGNAAAVLSALTIGADHSLGLSLQQLRDVTSLSVGAIHTVLSIVPHHLVPYDAAAGVFAVRSDSFVAAVKRRCYSSKVEELALRKKMAAYLLSCAVVSELPASVGSGAAGQRQQQHSYELLSEHDVRGLLSFAVSGQCWEMVTALFADLLFIERCAALGLAYDLLAAVDAAIAANKLLARELTPFQQFLERSAGLLHEYPMILHQLAVNAACDMGTAADSSALTAAGGALSHSARVSWFQQEMTEKYLAPPLCSRTERCPSAVAALANSRDGRFVAVGCADWTIRVHTQRDGRLRFVCKGHRGRVTGLQFSSDYLASSSADGSWALWSLRDGSLLGLSAHAHAKAANTVCVSKNADYLITGGDDTLVKVWDAQSRRCVKTFHGHSGPVTSVKGHSEGRVFASASWDRTVRIYEGVGPEGRCISHLNTRMRAIRCIAWAPSLVQTLACVSCDGRIKLFDVAARDEFNCIDGHYGRTVNTVAFSNDSKFIATGDARGCIKVWRSGPVESHVLTCTGHHNAVSQVAFNNDGKTLASGGADANVMWWRRDRAEMGSLHQSRLTGCMLADGGHADGLRAVTASRDGSAKVFTVGGRGLSSSIPHVFAHHADDQPSEPLVPVTSVTLAAGGEFVVTGALDGNVRVWAIDSQSQERIGGKTAERGFAGSAGGAATSSSNAKPIYSLRAHRSVVSGVAWVGRTADSPHANTFVSVGWDRSIKRWRLKGNLSAEWKDWNGDVQEVDEAKLLDAQRKNAHDMEIVAVRSNTSEAGGAPPTIATASFDTTVRVWCANSLAPMRTLRCHTDHVMGLTYHPSDPALLASVSHDGEVCVWDLARPSSSALLTSATGSDPLSCVAFAADEVLVVGGARGLRAHRMRPRLTKADTREVSCPSLPLIGTYFTSAPVRAVAAAGTTASAGNGFPVYYGDELGCGKFLTFHVSGKEDEWTPRSLRIVQGVTVPRDLLAHGAGLEGEAAATTTGSSESDGSASMESYSTWETTSTAAIFPGRGGVFSKFKTGEERKQYLMQTRNDYMAALKNRKDKPRSEQALSKGAQEHFDQSVCVFFVCFQV